ncbi:MAG: hypothetical protein ABSG15_13885 [FCB group bacterium]|jgi:hypothetical protein
MSKYKSKIQSPSFYTQIKAIILSKSFIAAIILAIALWGYTALNSEYKTMVDLPLMVKLPLNRAIENPLPSKISVKVKGAGWDIFYLIFFNTYAKCQVDLSGKNFRDSIYLISRNEILQSFQSMLNVEPLEVFPESLPLKTGYSGEHSFPVYSNIKVIPRNDFVVVNDAKIEPEYIIAIGNDRVLKNISKWGTKPASINDVYKPFSITIPLNDTLGDIVKLSQKTVNVAYDIQQMAELKIYNVEIKVKGGGSIPRNNFLLPGHVNITVRGGIDQIAKFNLDAISAYIDYSDIITDSTGIILIKTKVVDNSAKIIKVEPPFIFHQIRSNNLKLINS